MLPARASRAVADRRSFFSELKRRNVLRAAALYAGAVWAASQGISQLSPALGLPDLTTRWFLLAAAIGFPFWLAFAWFYEFTPQGLKRESEIDADASITRSTGRRLDRAIIAVLALAVVLLLANTFVWNRGSGLDRVANDAVIPDKSIAVLPLVDDSGEKDQQYFSDGLSEDLITALSQFAGLKVIARDSSFKFRNSGDDPKTIGAKLGVAHLLEGSVQRAGGMVRVSATLIKAADGTAMWSQHYDRPYKDLFALQDDITQQVAAALKAKLLDNGKAAPQSDRPPSGSLAAYNAYLQGEFYRRSENEADLRKAIVQFTEATRLDPDYAVAYAALSSASAVLGGFYLGGAEQQQLYAQARAASDTALRLDPSLAAAHAARALWMSNVLDWNGAQVEYRRALELAPNDPQNMFRWATVQSMLGHLQQATEFARSAEVLDPLSASQFRIGSIFLMALGRLDEAEAAIDRAGELAPNDRLVDVNRTLLDIHRGDAGAALAAAQKTAPGVWRSIALALALQIGADRAAADAALKDLIDKHANGSSWQIAEAYGLRRDPDNMFKWLDHAWATRDGGVQFLLHDPFILRYKDDPRFAEFARKVGLPTSTDAKALP